MDDEPEEPTPPVITDTFYEWCPQGDSEFADCIFCNTYLWDDNSSTRDCASCVEGLELIDGSCVDFVNDVGAVCVPDPVD